MTSATKTPSLPPPAPSFILRGHDAPVHCIEFFLSNAFLVTGDELGWICIWDIWRRRPVCRWHGHPTGSVLAVKAVPIQGLTGQQGSNQAQESHTRTRTKNHQPLPSILNEKVYILSHGRDNEIHVWDANDILQKSLRRRGRAGVPVGQGPGKDVKDPVIKVFSVPVNALNFCKMDVLATDLPYHDTTAPVPTGSNTGFKEATTPLTLSATHQQMLVAVPSPTSSSLIDIYDIVKPARAFASIGPSSGVAGSLPLASGERKWGAVMAIRLFYRDSTLSTSPPSEQPSPPLAVDTAAKDMTDQGNSRTEPSLLHMLVAYEDGSVALLREQEHDKISSTESKTKRVMDTLWSIKCHREPVLALDISSNLEYALSTGSDSLMVKYTLFSPLQGVPEVIKVPLKTAGISDIKIRSDNKIVVLAGWDGRIRVFSAKSLKPLAVLKYHRKGLDCLSLATVETKGRVVPETLGGSALDKEGSADATQQEDSRRVEAEGSDDSDSNDSESESESESDSEVDETLQSRLQFCSRHWIAVGGKEHHVSLWEIY